MAHRTLLGYHQRGRWQRVVFDHGEIAPPVRRAPARASNLSALIRSSTNPSYREGIRQAAPLVLPITRGEPAPAECSRSDPGAKDANRDPNDPLCSGRTRKMYLERHPPDYEQPRKRRRVRRPACGREAGGARL